MTTPTIKKISITQLHQLQSISIQTFSETFSDANTEENLSKYLNESFSTAKLTAELNNKNAEFYFASLDDTVIGYLKLNFGSAQTELQDDKAVEIERIYVLQSFQGKNVGQLLYNKAMERARQHRADYLWLGVWEKNLKAIRFYQKNSFVVFDKHLFTLGDEVQTDFMMKLELDY
jgi:diamine N-acetyltransferase